MIDAVADASRRTMLEVLRSGDANAGQLAELLPISRPGVSRHLRVLREAGLVDVRHDGQHRIYSLRPEPLKRLDEWLSPFRAAWEQRFGDLHTEITRGQHGRAANRRKDVS